MHDSASKYLILPGQGTKASSHTTTKVAASQLSDDYSVMEITMDARALLTPHLHDAADQVVVVLAGELEFEVGGEGGVRFTAPTGSYVYKPRRVQHSFWNATDRTARYIELSGGASFQGFVDSTAEKGNMTAADESGRYGVHFFYDRIPKMMLEHRLLRIAGMEEPWEELRRLSPKVLLEMLRRRITA
ncbi:MAG: cupin domain-containing protein [Nannocystaceae bacterium]